MPSDITLSDIFAFCFFFFSWFSISKLSSRYNLSKDKTSLYIITKSVRNQWMLRLLNRENRMPDVALLGHLMRSVSFFASTSLLVLASFITVFGIVEDAIQVTYDIPFAQHVSPAFWKLKLLLMVLIFSFVFFKLVWSIRQYNATIFMVGAAPENTAPEADKTFYAENLGTVINRASRHFVDGMRGYEYAVAALAWFINPYLFIISTILVSLVTYRREFASKTMEAMNK
ncbi:MAG: DUF599 domain-containing protein [Cocleimonas sp.]